MTNRFTVRHTIARARRGPSPNLPCRPGRRSQTRLLFAFVAARSRASGHDSRKLSLSDDRRHPCAGCFELRTGWCWWGTQTARGNYVMKPLIAGPEVWLVAPSRSRVRWSADVDRLHWMSVESWGFDAPAAFRLTIITGEKCGRCRSVGQLRCAWYRRSAACSIPPRHRWSPARLNGAR